MTHSQREIIFSEINKALSDAPRWGSISLTIHFSDGDVTHIDRDRTEEVRIGPARGTPEAKPATAPRAERQ